MNAKQPEIKAKQVSVSCPHCTKSFPVLVFQYEVQGEVTFDFAENGSTSDSPHSTAKDIEKPAKGASET